MSEDAGVSEQFVLNLERLSRIAFDIAISSMDFGSGFLDSTEVDGLRELAVALGVDPLKATPENFLPKFCSDHVVVIERSTYTGPYGRCAHCGWHGFMVDHHP